MTCTDTTTRFRLLDGNVGWEPCDDGTQNVSGVYDPYGLRIKHPHEPKLSHDLLSPYLPPPWLARGCQPGEWYQCGFDDRRDICSFVRKRDPCYQDWIDLRPQLAGGESLCRPIAVAAGKRRLAVVDRGGISDKRRLLIWSLPDGRLAGHAEFEKGEFPRAVAFAAWREVIVSVFRPSKQPRLLRFDLIGRARGEIPIRSGTACLVDPIVRLANGRDGALWAAEGPHWGPFHLWRIRPVEPPATPACEARQRFDVQRMTNVKFFFHAAENLQQALRPSGLVSVHADRFCIEEPVPGGVPAQRYFQTPFSARENLPADDKGQNRDRPSDSQLETLPIDSGIPRCRWHRVRVDADLPPRTSFSLQVATAESNQGRPHEDDWQPAIQSATDLLIDQPPGRYLFVRIRLQGSETDGPVIRRVRLDFPRVTSLEQLPAVYRDSPEAEDFTERFLSLFDAATEDLDRAIERFPALLDPEGVPEEVLPWLGTFLGIVFDSRWDADRRRKLLAAAPELYRRRGTVAGLAQAIELIFGDNSDGGDRDVQPVTRPDERPVITERVWTRALGVVGHTARLGEMRVFGKSEARFRVGRSALGVAPLRSYGNPDHDPVRADAHRFTVLMPPSPNLERIGTDQLERLIESQKPAHALHRWRIGGQGFILGRLSTIGIDTQLVPTPPPVLGSGEAGTRCRGNVYLRRTSILCPGPNRPTCTFRIGVNAGAGVSTLLE